MTFDGPLQKKPTIEDKGVLNSWETLPIKSLRISSRLQSSQAIRLKLSMSEAPSAVMMRRLYGGIRA